MASRRRQQQKMQRAFIALDLKWQHEARMRRARIIDRRAEADRMLEEKAKAQLAHSATAAAAARGRAARVARTQPVAPEPEYKPQGEGEQP